MAKLSRISGFPEWLPEQKLVEDEVIAKIKGIYESFGYGPIETPAVELLSTLGAKGVIDKEIFTVRRLKSDGDDEAELGLHFDLTVPFARYVAQHSHALVFPFKRYQLQKVWRGDRPQKGRYREFYQFDIDVVAREELPIAYDAEVISVLGLVMNALNFGPHVIRINNRKLLQGLYGALGLTEEQRKAAIVAVDKILKVGPAGVTAELGKAGIDAGVAEKILLTTNVQCSFEELSGRVAELGLNSPLVETGVQELVLIGKLLPADVVKDTLVDLSLARGLDYYTGLIAEVGMVEHPEFGTVASGGRYDNLTSEFTDQKLPGVGVSIGLSRLLELAFAEGLVKPVRKSPSQALVTVYAEDDRVRCNAVAQQLRDCGLATEVYPKAVKLGRQIDYADAKGMRYVFFVDSGTGAVQVKDITTKEQRPVDSLSEWVKAVKG